MRILLLDIETAPNVAYVWGLWQQNISPNQLVDNGYVLCWSAKWLGEEKLFFDSIAKSTPEKMLERVHKLLDQADCVVHYNGKKFDIPTLNREFLIHSMHPPSPSKQLDLYETCKRVFRFPSNKLDYISQTLGIGEKVRHEGHELWVKCMAKDKAAWQRMQEYNQQDVHLLEQLYERLLPWLDKHPNRSTHHETLCCTNCGGVHVQRRGYHVTTTQKYARYQCMDCGTWFRGNRSEFHAPEKVTQTPV